MSNADHAQIYLATPAAFELSEFNTQLAELLDEYPVVCVRIALKSDDPVELGRAADLLRETCHARDVAIVIDNHYRMVKRHGLDGVHLTDGAKHVRDARKELGDDAIVGAYCGDSRHNGMTAAEIGTDYISFGPLSDDGTLGDGTVAGAELFQWWSEMIEVPVIAEGAVTPETLTAIKDHIDFVTLGNEVWSAQEPMVNMEKFMNLLSK